MAHLKHLAIAVSAAFLVMGCAHRNAVPSLYCKEASYTKALYLYLQDDPDYAEQMKLMEKYLHVAESRNLKPAPGAYAHTALLHAKLGNADLSEKYLRMEQEAFPESTHYFDTMRNQGKTPGAGKKKGGRK